MKRIRLAAFIASLVLFGSVCSAFQGEKSEAVTGSEASVRTIGNLTSARAAHTTTVLDDGTVLIVGGMLENGSFYDTAEVFDPKTNAFKLLAGRMTKKRVSHTATKLKDGRVLIVGGWSNRSSPEKTAELFDPKNRRFEAVLNLSKARSGHTATLIEDGSVAIIGGTDGSNLVKEIEIFDPSTGDFKTSGNLVYPRVSLTATALIDGRILLAGGEVPDDSLTSALEIFDPKKGLSSEIEPRMSIARHKHDALRLADGKVLILGGSGPGDFRERSRLAEVFNPETNTIERVGDLANERFKISGTSVLLKDGKVLVAGGNEKAEIFDQKTKVFRTVAGTLGKALHFASTTLLGDGRAIIIGGYAYGNGRPPLSTSQVWEFNVERRSRTAKNDVEISGDGRAGTAVGQARF